MDDLVKSSQKALENQALRDQVSSYEREIMLQSENMEALRSFRHDMKRHFAEISVLASTGEIEQIKNYVSAMENNLVESRRLVDSGNTGLDTVLNYMLQRALDKKIQVNVKVVVPRELKLSAYDMTNKQMNPESIDRIEHSTYTPLEKKYLKVQFVKVALVYLGLMAVSLFLLCAEGFAYRYAATIIVECGLLVASVVNLLILPKAYNYKGFVIREHDITFRSGIIFPSVITVPFCKIQQVSVCQNPVTRLFGLYSVDLVNGAQLLATIRIPGLTEERADKVKALVIESIKNENK